MRWVLLTTGALSALSLASAGPSTSRRLSALGPQGVNLWKLNKWHEAQAASEAYVSPSGDNPQLRFNAKNIQKQPQKSTVFKEFEPQWFEQPLDHFNPEYGSRKWQQRYWVNKRHYKPGTQAPVIVLDGGETSGEDRLPFLDTGIVDILTEATGGVGVVLEHRYYGMSRPVPNFSTDSLRWLNNEQSAADSANFISHVKFDGIDEDLTAPGTPWIYYGGSYAGARAAHMRVLYPELVFGAIASSAVTHAMIENWQYFEVIRTYADPKCSYRLENAIKTIDRLLDYSATAKIIKSKFGLFHLHHNNDFASLLQIPLGAWQEKVWDPNVGSTEFDDFCKKLNAAWGWPLKSVADLPYEHPDRMVALDDGVMVDISIINYADWIKENVVSQCPFEFSQEDCFGTHDDTKFQDINIDQEWRLWQFQVCTQWGYFSTAPPSYQPRIVSRLLDLEYETKLCRQAFPPGQHYQVPRLPNITEVNILGDFSIAADRLAIIDGEVDPWRPNTPHSEYASDREDTILRPFKIIPNAVHHYDEYGLENTVNEPPEIQKIHKEMVEFVLEWLKDWKPTKTA